MDHSEIRKTVIIGSGPAGLTASIYAARAGLKPLVIDGMQAGGQLVQTAKIENFPGFEKPITGLELMTRMREQAKNCGVEFLMDEVTAVDFSGDEKKLMLMVGGEILAQSVIIATGTSSKHIGIAGETKYHGHGVSTCATCDGAFFKGKKVVVIGRGDIALNDALYLAPIVSELTIIPRSDSWKASQVLIDRIGELKNVNVLWNTDIKEICGDGKNVTSLKVSSEGNSITEIPSDGVFVAIGHSPVTEFLKGSIELNADNYIVTKNTRTNVAGVFAAGDATVSPFKQAVVAAGEGAVAAMEASRFLRTK
ncbi:MAG: thioredoxin-disulfide reductase [Kiritimatiellae bacterium]|nr:thioredoxin-disulfide reductase [Kiritimatiellia bacterium]